jgi:hypothetical protein
MGNTELQLAQNCPHQPATRITDSALYFFWINSDKKELCRKTAWFYYQERFFHTN